MNPLRAAIATTAVTVAVAAGCTGALAAPTTGHTITGNDGERIEYFTHGNPANPSLMISPAFTGSAKLYAQRFGAALPNWFVVATQLRAHGTGGGCTDGTVTWCKPSQAPYQGSYSGFRMPRMAADVQAVRRHLGLTRTAIMGHSIGMNVVTEYVDDYGTTGLTGMFVYDQSPKNLDVGLPAVASFPPGIATYPVTALLSFVNTFGVFERGRGYVNVPNDNRLMLGGPTGNPVFDPANPQPAFLLRESTWKQWQQFANRLNGKALGLMFWSTITQDYTDTYRVIRNSRMPVLVYGGKSSIVPWKAMQWVHEQLPGSEFMLFDERVGVHGAFLNPAPSGTTFMRKVRSFFERRIRPRANA